jgi:hypothetical protein
MRFALIAITLSAILATAANAQTVQLPSFNSFSVGTTVIAPDQGTAGAGGVRRTGSSWRGFGPLPGGAARDAAAQSGGVHFGAKIHDFAAIDEQLLGGSAEQVGAVTRQDQVAELHAPPFQSVAEIRRLKQRQKAGIETLAKSSAANRPARRAVARNGGLKAPTSRPLSSR